MLSVRAPFQRTCTAQNSHKYLHQVMPTSSSDTRTCTHTHTLSRNNPLFGITCGVTLVAMRPRLVAIAFTAKVRHTMGHLPFGRELVCVHQPTRQHQPHDNIIPDFCVTFILRSNELMHVVFRTRLLDGTRYPTECRIHQSHMQDSASAFGSLPKDPIY